MTVPSFRDKITQIFVSVDDFCLEFEKPVKQLMLCEAPDVKRRNRKAGLCDSEIISILIGAFTVAGSVISNFITPNMFACI